MHGNGVDVLSSGGTIVTRVSPDGGDFSIVIEKMSTQNSACARGSNPNVPTFGEIVKLTLKGALLAAAKSKGKGFLFFFLVLHLVWSIT
jgi:hypothetical protein